MKLRYMLLCLVLAGIVGCSEDHSAPFTVYSDTGCAFVVTRDITNNYTTEERDLTKWNSMAAGTEGPWYGAHMARDKPHDKPGCNIVTLYPDHGSTT